METQAGKAGKEGKPARGTLRRRRTGSGGDRTLYQRNVRCFHFRAGSADRIRNGCFGTWNQLAGEHAVVP